jgi:hypothetical protein
MKIEKARYDMQQQAKGAGADFPDINIADIKLPTAYEIRRSLGLSREGYNQGPVNTNYVTVNVTDLNAVGAVTQIMERTTGTSLKAQQRAAGLR